MRGSRGKSQVTWVSIEISIMDLPQTWKKFDNPGKCWTLSESLEKLQNKLTKKINIIKAVFWLSSLDLPLHMAKVTRTNQLSLLF